MNVLAASGLGVLTDNAGSLLRGFWETIQLTFWSGLFAFFLGLILAACRVSPVPVLRAFGTSYVNIFRNTPLVLLFILFVFGIPQLGIIDPTWTFVYAVGALGTYTAAFVCEAIRSGINSVSPGQAEAARSIGLTFEQNLRLVILPQAMRAVIPPLASVFIALVKNSAIAEAFFITEAAYVMDSLVRDYPQALYWIFFGTALGYIVIVFFISGVARLLEKRLEVAR